MEVVYIIIGLVLGTLVGFLFGRQKVGVLSVQNEKLKEDLAFVREEHIAKTHKVEEISGENQSLIRKCDKLETQVSALQESQEKQKTDFNLQKAELNKVHAEALEVQQARFNETMEKVTAQVKNATDEMLKQRQREFTESSHQELGQIVNPLKETIDKMKKAMEDNTEKQTSMSGEMRANIENMLRQSQAAKESADELTRVFKHQTKVQGDWGETVLEELLQSQGLTVGIHYDTQATIRDAAGKTVKAEDGSIMRPDVILHLDEHREVIIDSKVSLTAFMDMVNANDEEERQCYLKAHIDSIEKHVKELSVKDYSSYIQSPKIKMDYVIMFVPNTAALLTALNIQPNLWRKAMEKNVYIADEQTLYAALRIINLTWRQIVQVQNHKKVYELAEEMLNRVGQFWKDYESIGKSLDKLKEDYEHGKTKITDGGHSINNTAWQLIKLGAKQNDKNVLPPEPSDMNNESETIS